MVSQLVAVYGLLKCNTNGLCLTAMESSFLKILVSSKLYNIASQKHFVLLKPLVDNGG